MGGNNGGGTIQRYPFKSGWYSLYWQLGNLEGLVVTVNADDGTFLLKIHSLRRMRGGLYFSNDPFLFLPEMILVTGTVDEFMVGYCRHL